MSCRRWHTVLRLPLQLSVFSMNKAGNNTFAQYVQIILLVFIRNVIHCFFYIFKFGLVEEIADLCIQYNFGECHLLVAWAHHVVGEKYCSHTLIRTPGQCLYLLAWFTNRKTQHVLVFVVNVGSTCQSGRFNNVSSV